MSSQIDLIDPEFSQSRAQFIWNDEVGNLWIGNIDRDTGNFVPWDGKGILVDPDSMTYGDKNKTWNGPEWIRTLEGDHILYTKFKGRHTDRNARIGYAQARPERQLVRRLPRARRG